MAKDLNLQNIPDAFGRFLHRYHIMIFTLIAFGSLIYAMWSLNASITSVSSETTDVKTAPTTNFDKETIKKLDKLHLSNEPAPELVFPVNQRKSPFVE